MTKAVSVLEDWYLLDENAKPFGDKTLLGEYVLRTRKTLLRGEPVKESSRDREGAVLFDDLQPLPDGRGSFFQKLGVDYGKYVDADGKLRDTAAWVDVQFVLWSIVNRAFPATDLAGRFQTLHETSPGIFPSSVRFQASATEQEIWQGALQVANADRHVIAAVREIVDLNVFPDSTSKHAPTPTELGDCRDTFRWQVMEFCLVLVWRGW